MENNITPELRFPEFDGIIDKNVLNTFCEINPKTEDLPEKFIYIDLESVNNGRLEKENEITKEGAPSRAQRVLQKGDILFQTVRPYQKNNYFFKKEGSYVASTGYAQIRTNQSKKFIFHYLHTTKFVNNVLRRCTGTSYPAIGTTDLKTVPVFFPIPDEQEKVGSFLSSIDKRINLLEKKKTDLEQYKKGVMQKIFSQEIRFKKEDGTDFPDWEEKKLGNLGNTFNGLTGKTKVDFGEGKPYIQYMQIFSDSKINTSQFGLVKIEEGENQSKAQLGDVFFTTSSETPNEIGTASVLTEPVDEVYLNSFCFGFRPNSLDELIPEFSQFFFRSENVRRKIIPLAQGSTRFNMSKVELMKLKFDIPKKDEQEKIASFLGSIDKAIQKLENQIEDSKEFKQGLLQKMFV
ncbi:restriction endonuclease subunit S [Flavisericum labens]|uniref:restriction endonuclease subunit S n=1 Tax=Flavisericum labens TaxID=3377112 RepID=UPI00387B201D